MKVTIKITLFCLEKQYIFR